MMRRVSRNATFAWVAIWALVVVPVGVTTHSIEAPDVVGRADVDGAVADLRSRGFDVTVVRHEPPRTTLDSALVPPACAPLVGGPVIVAERAWRFALLPIKDWVVLYVCERPAMELASERP
jgi:hypothetical protein